MRTIIVIISCLVIGYAFGVTQPEAQGAVDPEEAVRIAYKMGQEDQMYKYDDLNTVRLSVKDIEKLVK